jgi:uncharacterized protein with PIN domain
MSRCKRCKRAVKDLKRYKFASWVDREIVQASCEVEFCEECSKQINPKFFIKIDERELVMA